MKRMRLWLRELSLTQQLLTIIFLFVAIFGLFVFFVLTPAVDRFSETEMYELLHNSQAPLISWMEENPDVIPDVTTDDDASIYQAVYVPDEEKLVLIGNADLPEYVQKDIVENAQKEKSSTHDYVARLSSETQSYSDVRYLYSVTMLKDGRSLVSVLSDNYRVSFQKSLVNNVVLMNIFIFAILLLLLLIWVGTLIYPLNQIKQYIQKVKNDEPAELNIKRYDEIGEVADALKDMDAELNRQNREKEEMIQNISHDLKTPIATIKSYSEAIKDGVYPYDTLEKSVDVIIEHCDRLEKKVKSLIVLNKMGYLIDECPEGNTLDMNTVIDKALLSLKEIRPEITFKRETDPGIKFHGEEEPWRITVENLIDNALRYAKTTITVTLHEGELCVINDGPQIKEDRLETLFHPYKMGTGGQFGLGLSIVHRVVTTYGYKVEAENLTDGVCFRITEELTSRNHKTRHNNRRSHTETVKKA